MTHLLDGLGLLAAETPSAWVVYTIPLVVLVLPFVLGSLLAKAMKLPDLSGRLGAVLFAGTLGLTPFVLPFVFSLSVDQFVVTPTVGNTNRDTVLEDFDTAWVIPEAGIAGDTYTVTVTKESTEGDFTTAEIAIESESGDDDVASAKPAATSVSKEFGDRGLKLKFTAKERPRDSFDRFEWWNPADWFGAHEEEEYEKAKKRKKSEDLVVGDSYTVRVNPAHFSQISAEKLLWSPIRLGIDLEGGTNLVFQAIDSPDKPITDDVMQKMVAAVGKRVNPGGVDEVVVRKVGRDRIEVIIPGAGEERVAQVKKLITKLGSLEFAILANKQDHADIIAMAEGLPKDENEVRAPNSTEVIARWVHVGLKDGKPKSVTDGGLVETRKAPREFERNGETITEDVTQFLVILDEEGRRVTGDYLTRVGETLTENGSLAVSFNFNVKGANLFEELTSVNQPTKSGFQRRLAILLDGQIHSAPSIEDVISGSGIIRGDFDRTEINELVGVLNAGALEVPLNSDPISEFSVSPLIGVDVIRKGLRAFLVSGAVVLVFMAVYYLWIGLIADVCLLFNLVMVMGTMSLIDATFTLPGLAGIVLTIGMAVDANVLIFERIREERARNSSVRMAIQNGFGKAFTTIVDANLTTLITAVVLYYIGTDQVKGFAVTLFIGIVMSMFSALFVGRLIFDIVERKRWLRELNMNSLIGATSVNFVGQRKIALVVSLVLIVTGIGTFFYRGEDNLDIDFIGGTMVTFQLTEPATTDEVREVLERPEPEGFGTSVTLERLALADDDASADKGRYFRLRTPDKSGERLRKLVEENTAAILKLVEENPELAEKNGVDEKTKEKLSSTKEKLSSTKEKSSPEDAADALMALVKKRPAYLMALVKKAPALAEKYGLAQHEKKVNDLFKKSKLELRHVKMTWDADAITAIAAASPPEAEASADDTPQAPQDPFAGGHQVPLNFEAIGGRKGDGELTEFTILDYLTTALEAIPAESDQGQRYAEVSGLLELKGEGGSGEDAKLESNVVRKWSQVTVKADKSIAKADLKTALQQMEKRMDESPVFDEVNSFASSVANEMRVSAVLAMAVSLLAIVAYIWLRFQRVTFGLAAVVALVHDVLVVLGMVALGAQLSGYGFGRALALVDFKINLAMIAAFLTIVGYSLNDTIVVFDRIREVRGKNPALTKEMVNNSLNQTLSRTLLTSLTTLLVVGILYVWGGEGIHGFAFCLVIGVLVGTYSSIYVASPTLLWLMNRSQKTQAVGRGGKPATA